MIITKIPFCVSFCGGSSATASHYQNDFNKGIAEYIENKFRSRRLIDNMAAIIAITNDIGFEGG